jgi:hypothetical protein
VRGRDFPRLKVVFADGKYHNYELYNWLSVHRRPYRLEVVSRPKGQKRFQPLPVRWVAERTWDCRKSAESGSDRVDKSVEDGPRPW